MEDGDVEESGQFSRRMIGGSSIDTTQWPTPDEGALTGSKRAQYFARKEAVLLYLSGATTEAIKRLTTLGAKQAYRLVRERCLETHHDGRPYGWRGLIPYFRIKPYKRHCR
ncbi:hypothetical protein [Collimonas sp. OK607]|uniref:hypothetical protein n=1 Tax=Collimonas sp. OK607 TaxID=1798194 RepID=UPI0011143A6C|nr:hypothetical protein [Collimonas sp. OK607]